MAGGVGNGYFAFHAGDAGSTPALVKPGRLAVRHLTVAAFSPAILLNAQWCVQQNKNLPVAQDSGSSGRAPPQAEEQVRPLRPEQSGLATASVYSPAERLLRKEAYYDATEHSETQPGCPPSYP